MANVVTKYMVLVVIGVAFKLLELFSSSVEISSVVAVTVLNVVSDPTVTVVPELSVNISVVAIGCSVVPSKNWSSVPVFVEVLMELVEVLVDVFENEVSVVGVFLVVVVDLLVVVFLEVIVVVDVVVVVVVVLGVVFVVVVVVVVEVVVVVVVAVVVVVVVVVGSTKPHSFCWIIFSFPFMARSFMFLYFTKSLKTRSSFCR